MLKNVILTLTDKQKNDIFNNYSLIEKSKHYNDDFFIIYHKKQENSTITNTNYNYFFFTDLDLKKTGFKPLRDEYLPIDCHFPILKFYIEHPNYDYYWIIEDDVRFNGDWCLLFDNFRNISSDFISSSLFDLHDKEEWVWTDSLYNPNVYIPIEKRIRSFNPIYRISNKAIKYIYESILNGWSGHHEVLIPTLLHNNNFTINDFATDVKYAIKNNTQNFYLGETMRYRPIFSEIGTIKNKLYHPVK